MVPYIIPEQVVYKTISVTGKHENPLVISWHDENWCSHIFELDTDFTIKVRWDWNMG